MSVSSGENDEQPWRSGLEPEVPQVLTGWRVNGLVQIGHTASLDDESAPIVVHQSPLMPSALGVAAVDARCRACVAHLIIARGEDRTLLILQHQRSCRELAHWLRQAGME